MSWTALTDVARIARKDHQCTWCGQPIPKGTRYQYSSGVFEGQICENKHHPECDIAAADDYRETGEGYAPFEQLRPDPLPEPQRPEHE